MRLLSTLVFCNFLCASLALLHAPAMSQDLPSSAESALYAATENKDVPGQLKAIQQLAEHYRKVNRPNRALSYYRLGLETDSTEVGKAVLLRQIAQVHVDQGELDLAYPFIQESIRILSNQAKSQSNSQSNSQGEIERELSASLLTMAHIRIEGLDFFQAQEDINESFRLNKALQNEDLTDKSYQALVRLRQKQGNVDGTQTALLEWAQTRKTREDKNSTLALAKSTTALSLCEKNWEENNFAGALKAARSGARPLGTAPLEPQPPAALELCKAKSLIKLNRHQELLADYAKLPPLHPLLTDPGMQLLVSRSHMGLGQYAKATSMSQAALQIQGNPTELQFALVENLILIELQAPSSALSSALSSPSNQNMLKLCQQAEDISTTSNSPVWSECALVNASAGRFDKALTFTQWAEQWFAEFGTPKQKIENRLIKALIQVELGDVEGGLLSVDSAINQIDKADEDAIAFERKANEVLGLAAEKKGERERATNFYKLALNAANAENNEIEMERLAVKLAGLARTSNQTANQTATQPSNQTTPAPKAGALTRVLTWFDQLRTPEYLRSLNPFKKKAE